MASLCTQRTSRDLPNDDEMRPTISCRWRHTIESLRSFQKPANQRAPAADVIVSVMYFGLCTQASDWSKWSSTDTWHATTTDGLWIIINIDELTDIQLIHNTPRWYFANTQWDIEKRTHFEWRHNGRRQRARVELFNTQLGSRDRKLGINMFTRSICTNHTSRTRHVTSVNQSHGWMFPGRVT